MIPKPVLACLLLFSLALPVLSASAQQRGQGQNPPPGARAAEGSLRGTVVDADTDDPVESATVAVWNAADSTLVTGAITLEDGTFALEGLRPGRYYVQVSFVGYRTQTVSGVELRPGALQADLGAVRLAPDTAMLEEVEVAAERSFMEVGIDKTVYNTRDQLVSVGGSASDVLANIPSVEVDIDGGISLRGNQNVAVLINGRPTAMTGEALTSFLQGLPADAVERVEVIPNPSARYEPDGMSGILNIVLKQDRDLGLGGSINAGIATQNTYNASGTLNYQQGRLTIFGNYGFRYGTRDSESTRFRENRYLDPLTFLDQADWNESDGLSHVLNTSLDYRLSKLNTLSLSALVSRRGGEGEGSRLYRELDADRVFTSSFDRRERDDRSDVGMDYRLAFRRVRELGKHELTAELRYETEHEQDAEHITEWMLNAEGTRVGDPAAQQVAEEEELNDEASFQVDYLRPLGNGKLEAGYKGSLEMLDSEFYAESFDPAAGGFVPDVHLNNRFGFNEQIHAAYGIASQEMGRFGVQVGVRLEQALIDFELPVLNETFENNYFSAFPSAFLTYQFTQNQARSRSVKLSYSKRVNRPNTWQLNPVGDLTDPLFRRVGNPNLKPEYVHAFEASYTQFSGNTSLTVSPYFRRTVDVIRWYETVSDQGVSILTFQNFDTSDSWGAEAIGTLRLGKWMNAYASFNAYRVVTDGSNVDTDLSNDAFGWTMRYNATLNVQPGLAVQLSYFYRAPMDVEGGRMGSFSNADLALRKQLLDEKASLSLRVSDLFDTMGFNMWREDARFYQVSSRQWESRRVHLTFTYNFGRQQQRRRDRGNNEQQGGGEGFEGMPM